MRTTKTIQACTHLERLIFFPDPPCQTSLRKPCGGRRHDWPAVDERLVAVRELVTVVRGEATAMSGSGGQPRQSPLNRVCKLQKRDEAKRPGIAFSFRHTCPYSSAALAGRLPAVVPPCSAIAIIVAFVEAI